jgi:hypothetical protein
MHPGSMTSTRLRIVGAVVLALLVAVGAGYVFSQDVDEPVPSAVSGDPVEPVGEVPLVRLAVVGDTGTGDAA